MGQYANQKLADKLGNLLGSIKAKSRLKKVKALAVKYQLVEATKEDFDLVKDTYIDVIDHTEGMKTNARWVYGQHPTDEMIAGYISEGAMYLLKEEDRIAGVGAVTMSQGKDYHKIKWNERVEDKDVSVVHILAVTPEFQHRMVGKVFVEKIISLAQERGKKAIRLDELGSNKPALRLFKDMGFIYTDERRMYADNTGNASFNFYEYSLF